MHAAELNHLKFRLGFNANTLTSPKIRGFTRHTLNLIEAIHKLAPKVEIYLFSNRELSPTLLRRMPFAKAKILPMRPYFLWEQVGLPVQLALDSIDIFHSTTNTGVPFFRPFYTSTVQTVHDLFTHENLAKMPRRLELVPWRAYCGFWPSWWAAAGSDALITVSEFSRTEIVEKYPRLAEKINIIPNAVDPGFRAGAVDRDILSRFGLNGEFILYVGGFEERKNVNCLVEAYRKLRGRAAGQPVPQLVLVGAQENLAPGLRQAVETTEGVLSLAYCTDEILLQLYRGALFGVFPSKKEGFGFPALEFASTGTPAILSDISAFHEIARDAAPYFDPEDSGALADIMWHIWREPDWRKSWAEKLSRVSENYTWEKIAADTLGVYQKLLAN